MTLLETTLNNRRRNLNITTQQLAALSGVREQKLHLPASLDEYPVAP